jgi:uncharacterized protein (DUF2147 family)
MQVVWIIGAFLISLGNSLKEADSIVGVWLTENDESKVQVYKENSQYFGKIIWLKEPNDKNGNSKRDINNPNPAKRNSPAIGIFILRNMEYKDGKWKGTIYGPKRGKEADCILRLIDKNTLEGTVKYGFMSGSRKWKRVQ